MVMFLCAILRPYLCSTIYRSGWTDKFINFRVPRFDRDFSFLSGQSDQGAVEEAAEHRRAEDSQGNNNMAGEARLSCSGVICQPLLRKWEHTHINTKLRGIGWDGMRWGCRAHAIDVRCGLRCLQSLQSLQRRTCKTCYIAGKACKKRAKACKSSRSSHIMQKLAKLVLYIELAKVAKSCKS